MAIQSLQSLQTLEVGKPPVPRLQPSPVYAILRSHTQAGDAQEVKTVEEFSDDTERHCVYSRIAPPTATGKHERCERLSQRCERAVSNVRDPRLLGKFERPQRQFGNGRETSVRDEAESAGTAEIQYRELAHTDRQTAQRLVRDMTAA